MNKLSDEILNKYIDNDLDQAASKMVREQLKNSGEDRKRLRILQSVDNGLRNVKIESVSPGFTTDLMKIIMKKSKAKKEQRIFIFSISSIFVIIALGILGYVVSLILAAPPLPGGTVVGTKETVTVLENIITPIKNILNKTSLSMIGSVFSLGLLISVYFVLDLMKHTRGKLGRQH